MHEVNRLMRLTENLSKFRKVPVVKTKEDIKSIIEECISMLEQHIQKKNINVKVQGEACTVDVDRGQIKQVFLNIIGNAIEAVGENGKIDISIGKDSNFVHIKVKDNGSGIPEDIIDEIFDPWFTTKKGGTGLGLPISLHIIKEHDGDIKVHSKQGEGTTFEIILPR